MEDLETIDSAVRGYPRMGGMRELKKALEAYWKQTCSQDDLAAVAARIRKQNWERMKLAGITHIPSNDFSYYDQLLDHSCLVGNIPSRFNAPSGDIDLNTYFLMARGKSIDPSIQNVPAQEMTKWFDTNYHYMVPEFDETTTFSIRSQKVFNEFKEATALGIHTTPVLIGPVTYLSCGKSYSKTATFTPFSLLNKLLPLYEDICTQLQALGATHIQIDEPIVVKTLSEEQQQALRTAYHYLAKACPALSLCFTSYFGTLGENSTLVAGLGTAGVHVDATYGTDEDVLAVASQLAPSQYLSLGVVNGRNIWMTHYDRVCALVTRIKRETPVSHIQLSTSCSLLHSPVSLAPETTLNPDLKQSMRFAEEKLTELTDLVAAVQAPSDTDARRANRITWDRRATSTIIHNDAVKARLAGIQPQDFKRQSAFTERIDIQHDRLKLPALPTTTIGSFPQTSQVRQARARFKKGELSAADYQDFLEKETIDCIRKQEELGLDVLVHGEFERNDMVEYFGEQLDGFCFTQYGWVQSYGSRCVKPPIIFGDVSRPAPMTVAWSTFAQAQTKQRMKGMLTGPITMLKWSFVRDDQPLKETAFQLALAIRDEVCDLEKAGISIIQIDEAAFREAMPIKQSDAPAYLRWAVDAFRLASSGVGDATQIHTHMCYSEFNDIIDAIAEMDADVVSIETSRSKMELLDAFVQFSYPNEIGPGVYDIHSPSIPSIDEITDLLKKALAVLPASKLWVNPDCGLKTRSWEEVLPSLTNMMAATAACRAHIQVAMKP